MDLVNTTAASADLRVGVLDHPKNGRSAWLVAKATFSVIGATCEMEADDTSFPVFDDDVPTPLGALPSDTRNEVLAGFEVIVLGAAYALGATPTTQRRIRLRVGGASNELVVFGDRRWLETSEGTPLISDPAPFVRLPLTWERAFGGRAEAWMDAHTVVPIQDPVNSFGRGFDAVGAAQSFARGIGVPEGFPRVEYERYLPNVEDPRSLIVRREDAPHPMSWSTVPKETGVHAKLIGDAVLRSHQSGDRSVVERARASRCHPSWLLGESPLGEVVVAEGLTPDERWTFQLPALSIEMDYICGSRVGSRTLIADRLVLLPDERRFYLVYRKQFNFVANEGEERSVRLRVIDGGGRGA